MWKWGPPAVSSLTFRCPAARALMCKANSLRWESTLPVIFLTAHADVRTSVKAMKAGATDFITKPFANQDLLDAVDHAIRLDGERRKANTEVARIRALADTLTPQGSARSCTRWSPG